jgi:hypothetical protein
MLASIGLLIYSIVLLVRSVTQKSRQLRTRALRIAIAPLIYIAGFVLMINWANNKNKERIKEVPGIYSYGVDSTLLTISLTADHQYSFSNSYSSAGGTWKIDSSTFLINFYDATRRPMGQAAWLYSSSGIRMKFLLNGKPTILTKK